MNKLLEFKLKTLREFQEKYPTSHVGGSIGLMLRGVDLKRDLSASDLDITIDDYEFNSAIIKNSRKRSDRNDFDYNIQISSPENFYVQVDIRINPEPSFEVVTFDGNDYNVSKLRDILFWKKKYAKKGVAKHHEDLITIETGTRPPNSGNYAFKIPLSNWDDDLPF